MQNPPSTAPARSSAFTAHMERVQHAKVSGEKMPPIDPRQRAHAAALVAKRTGFGLDHHHILDHISAAA